MRYISLAEQIVISKLALHCDAGYNTKFMSHHNKRYVALKAMYFRKRYIPSLFYLALVFCLKQLPHKTVFMALFRKADKLTYNLKKSLYIHHLFL
jgi:hypothetical protein